MELLADKFDQVIFVRSNQARSAPLSAAAFWCLPCSSSFLGCRATDQKEKKRKEKKRKEKKRKEKRREEKRREEKRREEKRRKEKKRKEKRRKEKKRKEKKREEKKRKEKFTLFSDHNGSLPRRRPGAMIALRERKKPQPKVDLACSVCVCVSSPVLVLSWMSKSFEMSNRMFM